MMMNPTTTPGSAAMEAAAIRLVQSESEAAECYPLMRQLRPNLGSELEFVERWMRQSKTGYRLSALWLNAKPVALAGYRILENLIYGPHLYVDDLVTGDAEALGQGHGGALLSHLKAEATARGCARCWCWILAWPIRSAIASTTARVCLRRPCTSPHRSISA